MTRVASFRNAWVTPWLGVRLGVPVLVAVRLHVGVGLKELVAVGLPVGEVVGEAVRVASGQSLMLAVLFSLLLMEPFFILCQMRWPPNTVQNTTTRFVFGHVPGTSGR